MKPSLVQDIIEAIYPYKNLNGEIVIEKVRKAGKKFSIRRPVDGGYIYKEATKGLDIPLYNLPDVASSDTVYIVEGEKDVETLRNIGLVATCNFDGAGKWKDCYSDALSGKNIVILPDNDSAGDKHCSKIVASLKGKASNVKRVDLPGLKEHGDVTDYISNGGTLETLLEIVERTPVIDFSKVEDATDKAEKPKKVEVPKALYDDYVRLFESVLDSPRRDIFSDDLLFLNELGFWEKARGAVGLLRSEAASMEDFSIMKFNRPLVEDHLDKFERTKKPELLIDVPEWDGIDRIKVFADALVPMFHSPLNQYDFDQLISDWLSKAWQRVYDPNVRNRILVLKSPQKVGKDWWTDSLLYGAGQFVKDLSVTKNSDKDSYLQLSSGMFLKVAEFEKLIKIDASVLKDMITKPFTDLRAPHDRATKRRYSRCSFIGSANSDDLLRDFTGSTRFIIFEVDHILFNYPVRSKVDGLQILAQARILSERDFKCNTETEAKLDQYLNDRTPEDPASLATEIFLTRIMDFVDSPKVEFSIRLEALRTGWIPNQYIKEFLREISQECECSEWMVRTRLTSKGLNVVKKLKGKTVRGYILPIEPTEDRGFDSEEPYVSSHSEEESDEEIPF